MANPYTSVTVTSYNSNPPADDGSAVPSNRVQWATHKTKIGDPLKTAIEAINTNVNTAIAKLSGGAGILSTATSYTVVAGDQGKTIKATASGITITTPDATVVTAPFKFNVLNLSSGDITLDGSGTQTVDGATTITIPAGSGVAVDTDSSNWFTDGQNFSRTQIAPQGYLTLVSATPVIVSDQSAKTSVFYTPDKGNLVPIPDGVNFSVKAFSELTLSLVASHVANAIYDVFIFLDPADDATVRIGTGPAWTTATAGSGSRGTGAGTTELFRLKGLLVNTVAATMRNGATTYSVALKKALYVGSLYMDGTNGQISCHVSYGQSRKWGVSNAYNRRRIMMSGGDGTASWAYSTATIRQSNAAAGNTIAVFCGLAEEFVAISATQSATLTGSAGAGATIGIGVNSTTATTGKRGVFLQGAGSAPNGQSGDMYAEYTMPPSLGLNNINFLEVGPGITTSTFNGTNVSMLMTAEYQG